MTNQKTIEEMLRLGAQPEDILNALKTEIDTATKKIAAEKPKTTLADRVTAGTVTLEDATDILLSAIKNEFPSIKRAIDEEEVTGEELTSMSRMRQSLQIMDSMLGSLYKEEAKLDAAMKPTPARGLKAATPKGVSDISAAEADAILKKYLGM